MWQSFREIDVRLAKHLFSQFLTDPYTLIGITEEAEAEKNRVFLMNYKYLLENKIVYLC